MSKIDTERLSFLKLSGSIRPHRPPLWSSGQSSWLQIQRFDSRCYQIFWEVVGLERGPLSLLNKTEELLGRHSSGSGLESREYGRRDPSRWPRGTLYPLKFALTSPTSAVAQSVVRSRTQATEFSLLLNVNSPRQMAAAFTLFAHTCAAYIRSHHLRTTS
jgi:hypothetical protein